MAFAKTSPNCIPTSITLAALPTAVSGHGPYQATVRPMFTFGSPIPSSTANGHAQYPTIDSVRAMMPECAMWPQSARLGPPRFRSRLARRAAQASAASSTKATAAPTTRRTGSARPVRQLRRLPRHVRGAKQVSHGPAAVDEPSLLAVVRLADLRLLPRADVGLLRLQESIGAAAHPMESASDTIEVVNYSAGNVDNLSAQIEVLDSAGKSLSKKPSRCRAGKTPFPLSLR